MAGVSPEELAALADGELPPWRRAAVEAAVAASPELARLFAVQVRIAATIRRAAARVEAPRHLRDALSNPSGRRRP
jgi:anti-sigma factor RsiW